VDLLSRATRKAMSAPEVASGLAMFAMVPATSTPAQLVALQRAEHDRWGPVVKGVGFTADT
jgi:tripartite-type tricarboxylate transporter receptor subunit TctC